MLIIIVTGVVASLIRVFIDIIDYTMLPKTLKSEDNRSTLPTDGIIGDFRLNFTRHVTGTENRRGHTGVFCDYESGEWNYRQFIAWISSHLLSFALTPREILDLSDSNASEKLERAAGNVYGRKNKIERRGEIGELILHGLVRDIFKTKPLISKIYFKTAPGEAVKGADCVHVIESAGEIDSLWLGEAKFYKDGTKGVTAAVSSVIDMLTRFNDRQEFVTIKHHLDGSDPIAKKAEMLLSDSSSLDKIKAKIVVPILVTYESPTTLKHSTDSEQFRSELAQEIGPFIAQYLDETSSIKEVELHIFFMPLKNKKALVELFDKYIDKKRSIEI